MTAKNSEWPSKNSIEQAIRVSWKPDTSEEPDKVTAENPGRGQCGATALVANDWLGGEILLSNVYIDEKQIGYHYSNLLPDGSHFDPSGDQFHPHEIVSEPKIIERIAIYPKNGADRYIALSKRVRDVLCT